MRPALGHRLVEMQSTIQILKKNIYGYLLAFCFLAEGYCKTKLLFVKAGSATLCSMEKVVCKAGVHLTTE